MSTVISMPDFLGRDLYFDYLIIEFRSAIRTLLSFVFASHEPMLSLEVATQVLHYEFHSLCTI